MSPSIANQCRSNDGSTLLMTSSDGFCSAVTFAPGELGEKYTGPLAIHSRPHHTPAAINTTATPSNQSTPTPTPTTGSMSATATATAPPMQRQPSAGFPASPSSFVPARPGSPTRSNSVSSIASFAPSSGDPTSMNAPTPAMSSVPSLAAANSGPVPMWTPPLTPAHGHGTHSASSSVSGIPHLASIGRRESERSESDRDEVSGSKKRELQSVPEVEEGRDNKKRRIAPIPVDDSDTAIASTEEATPTPALQ
jgi:chromatin assembly factor 1 subunit B